MLFNSLDFAIFLPIVFCVYWFVAKNDTQKQNLVIVISSIVFYCWWDWRFMSLVLMSSVVDFLVGNQLKNETNSLKRKSLLWVSLSVNLGLLCLFKYFNFFVENFIEVFSLFGKDIKSNTLHLILPLGISFYTFQTLSYTIDVYKRKCDPTKNFIAFFAFVSFFPQIVAGPIERATNLLPQFYKSRSFNYQEAVDGMRQILWGLFKKIVIADNCGGFVDEIFNNYTEYNDSTLLLGAIFFAFQIYGDFSGYSDIAIGSSRLFGINLKQNFAFPYFSRDFAEFWRRWHISLSSWFKDYLYIPLGGSRIGLWHKIRNVFVVFLISGFWHGANWTFIFWGALNAIYFLPLLLTNRNRRHLDTVAFGKQFPSMRELIQISITFGLTVLAWVFFRAETIGQAFHFISELFSFSIFDIPFFPRRRHALTLISLIMFFIIIEWEGREKQYAIENLGVDWKPIKRGVIYFAIVFSIFWFGGSEQQFIYFQF